MNKFILKISLILIAFSFFFFKCAENSENTKAFTKKLIVEDISSEWCTRCIAAEEYIQSMKSIYGDRFLPICLQHIPNGEMNFFSQFPDIKIALNNLISNLTNTPNSTTLYLPNLIFDRSVHSTKNIILNAYVKGDWESKTEELLKELKVGTGLAIETNLVNKTLKSKVKYQYISSLPEEVYITAYLVSHQIPGKEYGIFVSDVIHNNALLHLLTPKEGIKIINNLPNTVLEIQLKELDINALKQENLEIIAFIHKNGKTFSDRKIINGQAVKVGSSIDFD